MDSFPLAVQAMAWLFIVLMLIGIVTLILLVVETWRDR